jgi:hypothetical protein
MFVASLGTPALEAGTGGTIADEKLRDKQKCGHLALL